MQGRRLIPGGLLVLALTLAVPSAADAKLILITRGDTITEQGELGPELRKPGLPHKIGYKYSYFGVFWIDFWTWGGEHCVFENRNYVPLEPAQAAMLLKVPESQLKKPFLYRFPLGLILLTPLAILCVIGWLSGPAEPQGLPQLFQDARYQKALEILSEHGKQQPAPEGEPTPEQQAAANKAAFDAAVEHLVANGVPREDAEKNLGQMVETLATAPAK